MDININKIIKAAENGGEKIRKYFKKSLYVKEKSISSDYQTQADVESEKAIIKILGKEFPTFNLYSEEAGRLDKKSAFTFVIDPLDGTNNFMLGIPTFCVSIGLMEENKIIAGVIYHPLLNEMYYAQKGEGAFLQKKILMVNNELNITKTTVAYTCGYLTPSNFEENLVKKLHHLKIKRLLQNWCPSYEMCLVASGKMEAIINNHNELYDYCAGKIIVSEAGGKITDFFCHQEKDDTSSVFIASNGTKIHSQLIETIQKFI